MEKRLTLRFLFIGLLLSAMSFKAEHKKIAKISIDYIADSTHILKRQDSLCIWLGQTNRHDNIEIYADKKRIYLGKDLIQKWSTGTDFIKIKLGKHKTIGIRYNDFSFFSFEIDPMLNIIEINCYGRISIYDTNRPTDIVITNSNTYQNPEG